MTQRALIGGCAALAILLAISGYFLYSFHTSLVATKSSLASTTAALLSTTETNANLTQELEAVQAENAAFSGQISDISGTVGKLNKLANTDPQLLAKYSKTYFLNENYVPVSLTPIPPQYIYEKTRTYQFMTEALPFLTRLMDGANESGLSLEVVSSYRSFGEQAGLKTSYKLTYGSGANAFSADQGYSEHQLGTAVDFTNAKLGANFSSFASSAEYTWLVANAYKYGFVISYPKANTFYQFEPWHWRFVGVELATRIHDDNSYFYQLDQRDIDTFLANLFDGE